MKLQVIKTEVFKRVGVAETTALKRERPDLTQGRDLRRKAQWLSIYSLLRDDLTLNDLVREEQELKQSLHRIERLAGTAVVAVEKAWQIIQWSTQTDDLDITLADLRL